MDMIEKENFSQTNQDLVEVKEEINLEDEQVEIKEEVIEPEDSYVSQSSPIDPLYDDHTYVIKEEKQEINSDDVPFSDQPGYFGITKIINVNDLLKCSQSALNTSPKNKPNSPNSGNINVKCKNIYITKNHLKIDAPDHDNSVKREPCNDCMKYIEHYCIACKESSFYRKDLTQCLKCKTLLKLQCKMCHKRYKFLNSVHQYVLQFSKRLNLLSSQKKQVTFTCKKEQNFFCSKCYFKTIQKEELTEHIKIMHGQTTVTNSSNEPMDTTRPNKTIKTILPKKPIQGNLSSEPIVSNSSSTPETESSSKSTANSSKQSDKTILANRSAEMNPNEDDDQFIELHCPKCRKTCKRVVYIDYMKLVCRECQEEMLYRCTLCLKPYRVLKHVRHHVKCVCWQCINQTKLACSYCDYKAEVKSRLEFHIKTNHIPKKCPKCNVEFKNDEALRLHVMTECFRVQNSKGTSKSKEKDLDDVPLSIRIREVMLNRTNIQNSSIYINDDDSYTIIQNDPEILIQSITKRPPKDTSSTGWRTLVDYYCLQCDGEAKKKFSRYRPRCPKCKVKYDYRCISCEKLYGGYTSIYRHVKHECQNRFTLECSLCDYISVRKYLLLNHIKSKHTVYKCLRCNCRCEGYLSLRRHQSCDCKIENPHGTIHVKKLIALYCKHCYKRSRKPDDDNELIPCEKCTMLMSFQCLKCNQIFDDRDATFQHVKEECKPTFLCDKCNYKAYMQYDLDVHIKYVHTNRRCPDCGVQFKDEQIFRLHRLEEFRRKEAREKYLTNSSAVDAKKFKHN